MVFDFEKDIVDDKMYAVDVIAFAKMNRLETKSILRQNVSKTLGMLYNGKKLIPEDIIYSKYMSNNKIKKYSIKSVKLFTELVNVSMTKTCDGVMPFNGCELKEMVSKTIVNYSKQYINPDYVIAFMVKTNKFFSEGFYEFMIIIKKNLYGDTTLEYLSIKDKFNGGDVRLLNKHADFKRTAIWLHSMLKFTEYDTDLCPDSIIKLAVC